MRVLVVSSIFPYPTTNGVSLRTAALIEGICDIGHVVDLCSFGRSDPSAIDQAEKYCDRVICIDHLAASLSQDGDYWQRFRCLPSRIPYSVLAMRSKQMTNAIEQALQMRRYDVLLCDSVVPVVSLPQSLTTPVVLNLPNLDYVIMERYVSHERNVARRSYAWLEGRKLRAWERRSCSKARSVVVCSQEDGNLVKKLCPQCCVYVVPNVLRLAEYNFSADQEEQHTILYTGGMDWYPNRDAVQFFASDILPSLSKVSAGLKFVVAGRTAPTEFLSRFKNNREMIFTGTVPDMRTEIAKASICVVPLRIASGTRLKILEAAAMGKAIVSTSIGAEGLSFADGREIVIADKPAQFASAIARLLADSQLRRQMGLAARKRVEQEYSTSALNSAMRDMFSSFQPSSPALAAVS